MKLKYYLRGLGIGMILTTFILMISFSGKKMSDEEVIKRQLSECARVYTRSSQVMQQYREKELSER